MGILDQAGKAVGAGVRIQGRIAGAGFGAIKRLARGGEEATERLADDAARAAEQTGRAADEAASSTQQPPPQRGEGGGQPKDLDDVTIARKVESEIFRDHQGLKGDVDVNVVDGDVYLRGVAPTPEVINELEERTRAIPEVTRVENLLHLPNTPAPTRSDTPPGQRKETGRRTKTRAPRTEPRRLNADKTVKQSGDLPETLAKERKGRQPAPLGSSDPEPAPSKVGTEGGPDDGGSEAGR